MSEKLLLSIVEIGGYPNFIPVYQRHGYKVETLNSMRKAIGWLKRQCPGVIVAEFNFDPMFRDRMSNVESLLATLQRYRCEARVVLLLEPERRPQLEKVLQRYSVAAVVEFPVDEAKLASALAEEG
jgi:hypothetical protein